MKITKLPNGGELYEYAIGDKHWYLNGRLHREDGPAIIYYNGNKSWYLNDKLHREGGPAIEYPNGTKFWYIHGKRHREDGPAIEYFPGHSLINEYYLNNKMLNEKDFMSLIKLKAFW